MNIAIATANLYYLPFEQALDIIAGAGYTHVELALYWSRGPWAMAQHLKGLQASQAARMISRAGLQVACIHDGGGVLEEAHSSAGYINPFLREYLDALGYAPRCIAMHTPHVFGDLDDAWWPGLLPEIVRALDEYRACCASLTIENMPPIDGYCVPLTEPESLGAFCAAHDLGVTLDTSHYAQMGMDTVAVARTLRDRVRSVHLSDYLEGKPHAFVGTGRLDLKGVLSSLDAAALHAITLECSVGFPHEDVRQMGHAQMVERLRLAGDRVRGWLAQSAEDRAAT